MSQTAPAHFQWELVGDVAVIEILSRELNLPYHAQELTSQLQALLDSKASAKYLLDFHRTRLLSSTSFAALLNFSRKLQDAGAQARICQLDPDVRVGADIIGLGRFYAIHETEAEALTAFEQS